MELSPKPPAKGNELLKVASFNVNSVRSRIAIISEWLTRHQPDVLCLQETKVQDHEFPVQAIHETGYQVVFRGEKSYNGVAVITREAAQEVSFGFDTSEPRDETRLACVVVKGIPIVNTYVPQGRDTSLPFFQYKLAWFARLREYFDRLFSPNRPLVWMGDLNVAPEPRDVYAPKELLGHVCFCPEVSQAFSEVLSWGFVDVFRKHCPEPEIYTFYDYRIRNAVPRRMGWRVDHILATAPLARCSIASSVDMEPRLAPKPSDHTIITAEFDLSRLS